MTHMGPGLGTPLPPPVLLLPIFFLHISDSYTLGSFFGCRLSLSNLWFSGVSLFRPANLLLSLIVISLVPSMGNLIRQLFSHGVIFLGVCFLMGVLQQWVTDMLRN